MTKKVLKHKRGDKWFTYGKMMVSKTEKEMVSLFVTQGLIDFLTDELKKGNKYLNFMVFAETEKDNFNKGYHDEKKYAENESNVYDPSNPPNIDDVHF